MNENNGLQYTQLIPGNEYRFVCRGVERTGRFLRTIVAPSGPHVVFNHINTERNPNTEVAVNTNGCRFDYSHGYLMVGLVGKNKQLPLQVQSQLSKYGGKSRYKCRKNKKAKKSYKQTYKRKR
jgi:hypothetical protein